MPTPISTLPVEELAAMYRHAQHVQRTMRNHPYMCMWYKLAQLEVDMELLWQAMEEKIPTSHNYEIYKLLKQ